MNTVTIVWLGIKSQLLRNRFKAWHKLFVFNQECLSLPRDKRLDL